MPANLLIGLSAWFPSSKPPLARLAGMIKSIHRSPNGFPLVSRSIHTFVSKFLVFLPLYVPFFHRLFLIFFISNKGEREGGDRKREREKIEGSLASLWSRELDRLTGSRNVCGSKHWKWIEVFFSTRISGDQSWPHHGGSWCAAATKRLFPPFGVSVTWLVSNLSSRRIRKGRASERTSARDEIRSGRLFARMERVGWTGRSYHRHDINFRGFFLFAV